MESSTNMDTFVAIGSECTSKEVKKLKKNHCHFCFLYRFDCEGAMCGLEGKEMANKRLNFAKGLIIYYPDTTQEISTDELNRIWNEVTEREEKY